MVNYFARLGWAHGDQEVFTREELVQLFDLRQVGRHAGDLRPDEARVAEPGVDEETRGGSRPVASDWPRALVVAPRRRRDPESADAARRKRGGEPDDARDHAGPDRAQGAVLLRGSDALRPDRDRQAGDAGARPASGPAPRAPREPRALDGERARGRVSAARRRAEREAGRPGTADPPRAHRRDREPADLRHHGGPRTGDDAAPSPRVPGSRASGSKAGHGALAGAARGVHLELGSGASRAALDAPLSARGRAQATALAAGLAATPFDAALHEPAPPRARHGRGVRRRASASRRWRWTNCGRSVWAIGRA